MDEAAHIIAKLGLKPLQPEGGFYAPTWSSTDLLPEH
jgi:predicted cupin superfamily sugar epimerase